MKCSPGSRTSRARSSSQLMPDGFALEENLGCGGAVQAAGGGLMARLGRGRRGLGALAGHGGQHELGDRRRRDHERSGAWRVRAWCPRRRRIMSAVASSPTWRHVLVTVAAAGAFSLVLLAAPSDAPMVPSAEAQASVS